MEFTIDIPGVASRRERIEVYLTERYANERLLAIMGNHPLVICPSGANLIYVTTEK